MLTVPLQRHDAVVRPERASATVPTWRSGTGQSPVASAVRATMLLLAAVVALADPASSAARPGVAMVVLLGLVSLRVPEVSRRRFGLAIAEVLVACTAIAVAGVPLFPLLVVLPASAIAAGLAAGYIGALAVTGVAATALVAGGLAAIDAPGSAALASASAQWVLVALATSLLTGRICSLTGKTAPSAHRYVEAHRLLGQLRAVTRGLPGSLDPGSVAKELLEGCVRMTSCEYGAVLLNVGGDQLVPLALHGYQRVPWRASLTSDGPISRAWMSGASVVDRRALDPDGNRLGSTLMVVPMSVGNSRVGVVALESREHALQSSPALEDLVAQFALPLETAGLFDELRISAANEERTRLAREMHDGIAQDLAFVGYELDALIAVLSGSGALTGLEQGRHVRQHVTSLISDLRLSLSDLRSSIGPGRGLGAALSDYVRSAGTSSGLTVHLTLTEGSTRLSANTEVQLLRIAYEAINRARRRPGASSLGVWLEVDPPCALLVVEDDAPASAGRLEVDDAPEMRERAERLGAVFSQERRGSGGVRVRVQVGG